MLSHNRDRTWVDETGEHDPDFRPFAVPATVTYSPVHSHHESPRRRSLDMPSKGVRGPLTLEPGLYAALRAHERVLAEQSADDLEAATHNKRCESRRPSFLGRPRCRSRNSSHRDEQVFSDESDDDSSLAYSPPPLPSLELDSGSDEQDDDNESDEKHGHDHDLKHQLAGLHLRVDLALFRVKKRLRRRVGLD